MCGLATKTDNTGFQPRFELLRRQVEKNAEPASRSASDVVRAGSVQRNGIEPERVRACQSLSRQLAGRDAGYVSISQRHIVLITHRKIDRARVLLIWSNAAPAFCRPRLAGERALIVNPHEIHAVAVALTRGLEPRLEERRERHSAIFARPPDWDIQN